MLYRRSDREAPAFGMSPRFGMHARGSRIDSPRQATAREIDVVNGVGAAADQADVVATPSPGQGVQPVLEIGRHRCGPEGGDAVRRKAAMDGLKPALAVD